MADKLAHAFGLQGWNLLMPSLPADILRSSEIEQLFESYKAASPEGRKIIRQFAHREAEFAKKNVK